MLKIKNSLCAFFLAVFFSSPVWSEEVKPSPLFPSVTQVGAQLRLRPELRDNTDFLGNRLYSLLRFRMNAAFNINPETLIYIQPQFSKVMGEALFLGDSGASNTVQATSGVFFDTAMTVHQAYLDYKPFSNLQMIAGRQILSYGDEVLVGAAMGWANVGRSFDGVKFVYQQPGFRSDLFWTQLVETSGFVKGGIGNADFSGFYNAFDLGSFAKNFDLYAFYLSDTRQPTSLSLWTLGSRLKSSVNQFDYRVEVDYQIGTALNQVQTGNQGDFEVGYLLDSKSKMRVATGGFISSPNYNQLFPAAHKWLGYADVLGRRNVMGGMLKFGVSPMSKLNLTCDLLQFYRTSKDAPAYKLQTNKPLGEISKSSSSSIGTELDVNLSYQLSESIQVSTGVNTLFASDYLTQNFGKTNPMYAFFEVEARY